MTEPNRDRRDERPPQEMAAPDRAGGGYRPKGIRGFARGVSPVIAGLIAILVIAAVVAIAYFIYAV